MVVHQCYAHYFAPRKEDMPILITAGLYLLGNAEILRFRTSQPRFGQIQLEQKIGSPTNCIGNVWVCFLRRTYYTEYRNGMITGFKGILNNQQFYLVSFSQHALDPYTAVEQADFAKWLVVGCFR
jgi:hypothetical protein